MDDTTLEGDSADATNSEICSDIDWENFSMQGEYETHEACVQDNFKALDDSNLELIRATFDSRYSPTSKPLPDLLKDLSSIRRRMEVLSEYAGGNCQEFVQTRIARRKELKVQKEELVQEAKDVEVECEALRKRIQDFSTEYKKDKQAVTIAHDFYTKHFDISLETAFLDEQKRVVTIWFKKDKTCPSVKLIFSEDNKLIDFELPQVCGYTEENQLRTLLKEDGQCMKIISEIRKLVLKSS